MKYAGADFAPYSEASDKFIERFDDFQSRLFYSSTIEHFMFHPMPDSAILDNFYNGSFIRSANKPTPETEFTAEVIEVCQGVKEYLDRRAGLRGQGLRLHDVGCGFGAGVWAFQQVGFDATGNEANREWVDQANPFCRNALSADPLKSVLNAIGCKIDVFFVTHVFEHLPDPLSTMRLLAEHLSDRGVIYICVPNSLSERNAAFGRRTGVDYGNFPMHLNFFTPKSMMHMLSEAGLDVVDIESRPMDDLPDRKDDTNWIEESRSSLHGGELFVLAAKPSNRNVERHENIAVAVEAAHARFRSRRRSAFIYCQALGRSQIARKVVAKIRHLSGS